VKSSDLSGRSSGESKRRRKFISVERERHLFHGWKEAQVGQEGDKLIIVKGERTLSEHERGPG